MFRRSSGLLIHVTSLPGPDGIGDVGPPAREFVDILSRAGQHFWQVLPIGPVGAGNSPYDARSTFAGNPLLISLDDLVRDGLLTEKDLKRPQRFDAASVEFRRVTRRKERLFRSAHRRFLDGAAPELQSAYEQFVHDASEWLEDFALYQAIRNGQSGTPWYRWDDELRLRDPDALTAARFRVSEELAYQRFVQFIFERQWGQLKAYAAERDVVLMGDVPIYVALDSADVWANQEQFLLDGKGQPVVQAGVPPDMFSETGQLWGNPVYNWERMRVDGYRWWKSRIKRTLSQTDIVRIDHFRGFAAGWQVPAGEKTAINGEWVPGPGIDLFRDVRSELGELPIVVEDLGVITPDVEQLRDDLGYPGMKVLQFAFDGDSQNPYLPHNAVPKSMVYTGTHDNDTLFGWYDSLTADDQRYVRRYARANRDSLHRDFLRLAWGSVSLLACAPVQDVLGLGTEARMNVPGKAKGNWGWRLIDYRGLRRRANLLRSMTELYGRDQLPLG